MNSDGTLNENCPIEFQNISVKKARKKITEILSDEGLIAKVENHTHQVGHSERTNAVVEPYISKQWFYRQKIKHDDKSKCIFYF